MRKVIPCVILFLSCASMAQATSLYGSGYRPWMDICLSGSRMPTPNVRLEVVPDPNLSWAAPWDGKIGLYAHVIEDRDCSTLLHEIGHVWDNITLNDYNRHYLACRIMGEKNPNPWWGRWNNDATVWLGGEGKDSPIEHFAEWYEMAAMRKTIPYGIKNWWQRPNIPFVSYQAMIPLMNNRRLKQIRIYAWYIQRHQPGQDKVQRTARSNMPPC